MSVFVRRRKQQARERERAERAERRAAQERELHEALVRAQMRAWARERAAKEGQ